MENNSCNPPYRIASGVRFVKINGSWISTAAIESISKPAEGCVEIRTISGDVISVAGVYSEDALARGILGNRNDSPVS